MKRCPTCQLTYTDPTLRFCLEDGTALIDVPTSGDETVVMNSATGSDEPPPTEILPYGPPPTVRAYDDEATAQRNKLAATARQQARPTINEFQNGAAPASLPETRKTTSVVAITAIATILVLAAGGLGVWLVMREKAGEGGSNTRNENISRNTDSNVMNSNGRTGTNTNSTPGVVISPSPTATPTGTPSPTPTRSPDNSTARSEVLAALNGWTETMKRADLNGHMAYYAPVLHTYYNARNYNVAGVRANVARAFAKYTSFDVRLTNIQVDVDPSGTNAIATFTKTFVFSGADTYRGSGLNRFWFEKIGGRWLITGEKDFG